MLNFDWLPVGQYVRLSCTAITIEEFHSLTFDWPPRSMLISNWLLISLLNLYWLGQYVRLSCTAITPEEFHSLTLTSSPHEDFLSVHIKAIGPWTWKLRQEVIQYTQIRGPSQHFQHPHLFMSFFTIMQCQVLRSRSRWESAFFE